MLHKRRTTLALPSTFLLVLGLLSSACTLPVHAVGSEQSPAPRRDTIALVDSLLDAGRTDSVLTLIPELLDRARSEGDSVSLGGLLVLRGRAELVSGDLARSEATLTGAINRVRTARDTLNWMGALRYLGFGTALQGRFDEAMGHYEEMIALATLTGKQGPEAWARIGVAYLSMIGGDNQKAKSGYIRAIRLFRNTGATEDELTPLLGLGRIYSSLGEADSARACFQKVWLVATEIGDPVRAGHSLNNLGTLEHLYGDISLAIEYYRRAFEFHQSSGNLLAAITPATNTALAYEALGRHTEAADMLERALAICEQKGMHEVRGRVLIDLGSVQLSCNKPVAAAALYRRALAMGDTLGEFVSAEVANGLARTMAYMDSTAAAIEILNAVLADPKVGKAIDTISMRVTLAGLLRRVGQPRDALATGIRAEEDSRKLPGGRVRVSALFELSRCYREAGRADSSMLYLERAFDALDRSRWSSEDKEWREMYGQEMSGYVLGATRILLEYPRNRPPLERKRVLFDTLQRYKAQTLRERIADPRKGGAIDARTASSSTESVTLRQVQDNFLAPGDLLLDFFMGDDDTWLFAVTHRSVRLVSLPGRRSDLREQVARYVRVVGTTPSPGALSVHDIRSVQATLGERLLGDVSDLVDASDRIIIVPDGYLHALPFATLVTPNEGPDGRNLVDSKVVYRLPSTSLFTMLRSSPAEVERPTGAAVMFATAVGDGADGAPLRGARDEVKIIADRYAGVDVWLEPYAASPLKERMASSNIIHIASHVTVNDERPWHSGILLGTARTTHATRALAKDTTPTVRANGAWAILSLEDSLAAAGRIGRGTYLRAFEIAGLHLRARLAVLSGCESAMGCLTVGEGVLGLGAAFMSAGVPSVVASLWPVDDRTTVDFMKAFYDELTGGKSVAAALRGAQLTTRQLTATRHPFYWAGFVIIGDGQAVVDLERRSGTQGAPLPVVATIVALFGICLAGWRIAKRKYSRVSV